VRWGSPIYPGKHAVERASQPAFIMATSGEAVTNAELEARSNRLAHLLRARGLARLDHYAIFMENNARYLEGCVASPSETGQQFCLTILTSETFRRQTYPPRDADSDPEAVFRRVLRCGRSVALRTVVAFDNHHIPRGVRSTQGFRMCVLGRVPASECRLVVLELQNYSTAGHATFHDGAASSACNETAAEFCNYWPGRVLVGLIAIWIRDIHLEDPISFVRHRSGVLFTAAALAHLMRAPLTKSRQTGRRAETG
jgi:hypothetical protein